MAKTSVLIVEDEIIVAKNTEVMLRSLDYNIIDICPSGEKAIKTTVEKHPDLILMDIVLAGKIDGIEAARQILEEVDVPIIFTTSYSDDETLKRAKETTPYGYIIKPFQKKELLASIEIAIERHTLEQINRQNEQLLQTTLQSISDGIITTDKKGNVLYINNIGESITGWSTQEVIGKPLKEVFKFSGADKIKDLCKIIDNPSRIKEIVKIPSATLIDNKELSKIIEGSISPIIGKTGKISGFVFVFRDITVLNKAQRIQNTLYNISNAVNSTNNIQELFESIQEYLGEIIDTKNFYVALYDKKNDTISLPYIIDQEDKFTTFPAGKTLTGYVIKDNKSMLVDQELNKEMTKKGLIESIGSPSKIWLGVPLRIEKEVIGVVAVQSYDDENLYTKDDLEILEFVSEQMAIAISHKRVEDAQRVERAYFEQLFENAPEAIVLIDNESRILRMNEEFTRTFGYTIEEAQNKKIDELLTRGEYGKEAKKVTGKIAKGETVALESVRWHKNGTPVDVSILGTPIIFGGGQLAVYGIYRDISDKKAAQEALKKSEERYRELIENVHDIIYRFDLEGVITYINTVGEKIFGMPSDEIVGKRTLDIVQPENRTALKHFFQRQYLKKTQNTYHEFEIIKKNNEKTWLGQNTSLLLENDKIIGFQAIARDITSRKKAEEEIREANKKLELLSRTDPLTQLSNRRDVIEKIRYEKRRYGRSEQSFTIMICDIDDFKVINDTFGHDAGDEVLKTLANIMCMNVRKQDTVARWGGEEFLLLLPQTEAAGGLVLAEKIRSRIKSKEFKFLGKSIHITITIGLSVYHENRSIEDTINQADQALYMGKKLGKDCVKCETDLVK
ncbi:MAG: PAS domain S-box protein [Candidatus Cloacimonetes bacterium]|nr:PAS domain S-box protein [Candidatus Cloacimonadota bacterium]